jgi:sulfite reductase (NADPH) flavoprotein alpha-component
VIRRWSVQIHLWTGLITGVYMVLMSVTGSAVVFRGEIGRLLTPMPHVAPSGSRRTRQQLTADAERALPQWTVTDITVSDDPAQPVEIRMRRGQRRVDKIFNPYTGELMGERIPREPRAIEALADLHDNLLAGARGRFANGIGAITLTILCVTGAFIWWPRSAAWRRSLFVTTDGTWRQMAWSAHSAVGFWMLLLLLIWALSGIYLAFPTAFDAAGDVLDRVDSEGRLSGGMYRLLGWMSDAHFGRFAGNGTKVLWVVLGFAPAFLFASGVFIWWTRVKTNSR